MRWWSVRARRAVGTASELAYVTFLPLPVAFIGAVIYYPLMASVMFSVRGKTMLIVQINFWFYRSARISGFVLPHSV